VWGGGTIDDLEIDNSFLNEEKKICFYLGGRTK